MPASRPFAIKLLQSYWSGILLLIILFACSRQTDSSDQSSSNSHHVVPLAIEDPYQFNQYSGDSIHFPQEAITNGITIKVTPEISPAHSFPVRTTIEIQNKLLLPFESNETRLRAKPLSFPFLQNELTYIFQSEEVASYKETSNGDSVLTGVPFPFTPTKKDAKNPLPHPSISPRLQDNNQYNVVHYGPDEGMRSIDVWCVLKDRNGNMWFATEGAGVSKFDGENYMHFTENEGLSSNIVFHVMEDSKGNLWFSTWGGGACMYDGQSFHYFTIEEGMTSNVVWVTLQDGGGNIWFATNNGISRFDGEKMTHFTTNEGLPTDQFYNLLEDKEDNIWAIGEGLIKYDCNSFAIFDSTCGMPSVGGGCFSEDINGNIWFGTWSDGVIKFDGNQFTSYTSREGLSNDEIFSITTDKKKTFGFRL